MLSVICRQRYDFLLRNTRNHEIIFVFLYNLIYFLFFSIHAIAKSTSGR